MTRTKRSRLTQWIPWLVTVLAVAYIGLMIPWRDSVVDGSHGGRSSSAHSIHPVGAISPSGHDTNSRTQIQPGVLTLLGQIRWPWIAAYLLCMFASGSLLVVRWQALLKQGVVDRVSLGWCARTWAQAQVISLLPIGQVGADAYRIERSTRRTSSLGQCSGIIVVERLMGLLALLLVGTAGIAIKSQNTSGYWLLIATAAMAVGIVVVVPRVTVRLSQLNGLTDASGWRVKFREWIRSCGSIVDRPHTLARVLVLSILVQTLTPLSFAIVDRAMGFNTPVWCYLVAVPTVLLAQFLPIHVAGIGILEGGLGAMLGPWAGRSAAEVIALCALVRILGLSWSALLAVSFVIPIRSNPIRFQPPEPTPLWAESALVPKHGR